MHRAATEGKKRHDRKRPTSSRRRLNIDMDGRSLQPTRLQVGMPGLGDFTGAVEQDRKIAPALFDG